MVAGVNGTSGNKVSCFSFQLKLKGLWGFVSLLLHGQAFCSSGWIFLINRAGHMLQLDPHSAICQSVCWREMVTHIWIIMKMSKWHDKCLKAVWFGERTDHRAEVFKCHCCQNVSIIYSFLFDIFCTYFCPVTSRPQSCMCVLIVPGIK